VREPKPLLHRLLRVEPIADGDHHATMNFLYDVRIGGRPVAIARLPSLYLYVGWPRLLRPIAPVLNHLALAWQALRGVLEGRFAVIREFRNGPFLCVAPVLWPFRRRMVLVINGNIPGSIHGGATAFAFRLLVAMRFRFLLFDGELVRSSLEKRYPGLILYAPLFCVPDKREGKRTVRDPSRPFVLGLVGDFRDEKGGTQGAWRVVKLLLSVDNLRIAIGYRHRSLLAKLPSENVDLMFTGDYEDYVRFMRSCDAMLFLGVPGAYEIRHSGALLDCLAFGTPAICPGFLLWASVVSRPVPVGLTYSTDAELKAGVTELAGRRKDPGDGFTSYYSGRNVAQVQECIEAAR
jgi:hypothetical protein